MKQHHRVRALAKLGPCALALAACTTVPRLDTPPAASLAAAPAGFSQPIRAEALDRQFFEANAEIMLKQVKAASDGSFDILALSGGGAGGAFGAGVMVGLTQAKARPKYEIVTGVSTGALIAPFAFLGPQYDATLIEAFGGKATGGLLVSRGLGALFGVGVFQGAPLRELIERFVTDDLVAAVAKEAKTGRLLLVATTNLDREETQIWNLGAIAMQGGPKARDLFRDVLIASASVPGVFPPVMIEVEDEGTTFQEMHVDGGASTPFFVAPDIAMVLGFAPEALRGAHIFVVVNAQAATMPRSTRNNTMDIVARSFTAVLNHMTRTALSQTAAFAERNGMSFAFTVMPQDLDFKGSLAFEEENMKSIFDYGVRCASQKMVWVNAEQALEHAELAGSTAVPSGAANCPLLTDAQRKPN